MVSVKCENGKFLLKGTFDMGIAGVFENKEYGKGNIEFDSLVSDVEQFIKHTLDRPENELIREIKQFFADVPRDADSLAKAMEDYINKKEEKVQKNIVQLNNYFLYKVIEDWVDCETPFWECREAILPEYADKYDEEAYEQLYEDEELCDTVNALYNEYDKEPNDGSMEKTDVLALAKKLFPMFDFDGLMKSIHPDILVFEGSWMFVQISDDWGCQFYCSALVKFNEDLAPVTWQNF